MYDSLLVLGVGVWAVSSPGFWMLLWPDLVSQSYRRPAVILVVSDGLVRATHNGRRSRKLVVDASKRRQRSMAAWREPLRPCQPSMTDGDRAGCYEATFFGEHRQPQAMVRLFASHVEQVGRILFSRRRRDQVLRSASRPARSRVACTVAKAQMTGWGGSTALSSSQLARRTRPQACCLPLA